MKITKYLFVLSVLLFGVYGFFLFFYPPYWMLPRTVVRIAVKSFFVHIASDRDERRQGLQGVTLRPGRGLLFSWRFDTDTAFWMFNTPAPLTLVFLSAEGRVLAVRDMPVQLHAPYVVYRSPVPYRYALELPLAAVPLSVVGDSVMSR